MSSPRQARWLVLAGVVLAAVAAALSLPSLIRSGSFHRGASALRHRVLGRSRHEPAPGTAIAVTTTRLAEGRRLIAAAIARSAAEHDYAIAIDKSAYTLLVYHDGRRIAAWPVELGPDPVSAKVRQGDLCTPEGLYRVAWRRDVGETRFYRALLLDYPNAADRRAGLTGSHIEIHGMGSGKRPGDGGHNWTLGCIALSNRHMDELFGLNQGGRRITEGTPVTIVYAGTLEDPSYQVTD